MLTMPSPHHVHKRSHDLTKDSKPGWKLDNTFNGRFVADIEAKGRPSRWITLRALQALRSSAPDA